MTGEKISYDYVEEYDDERIIDDPNLESWEKEVFIHLRPFEDGKAIVDANKTSIVRGLINHDEAEIKQLRKYDGNIVGGKLYIPIGLVKIKQYSRSTDQLSRVVSY